VTVTCAVPEHANLGRIAGIAGDTRRVLADAVGRVTARRQADIRRREALPLGLDPAFARLARCLQRTQVAAVAARPIRSRYTLPRLAGLALIAGAGLAGPATAISGATGLAVAVRCALGDARPIDTRLVRRAGWARRLRHPTLPSLLFVLLLVPALGTHITLVINAREHAAHNGERDQSRIRLRRVPAATRSRVRRSKWWSSNAPSPGERPHHGDKDAPLPSSVRSRTTPVPWKMYGYFTINPGTGRGTGVPLGGRLAGELRSRVQDCLTRCSLEALVRSGGNRLSSSAPAWSPARLTFRPSRRRGQRLTDALQHQHGCHCAFLGARAVPVTRCACSGGIPSILHVGRW
jgi:hypothetical protein